MVHLAPILAHPEPQMLVVLSLVAKVFVSLKYFSARDRTGKRGE